MKVLIVTTTTPDASLAVKKIRELSIFNHHTTEVSLCLLGIEANEQVSMPEGLTEVLALPFIQEEAIQESVYLFPLVSYCTEKEISLVLFYSNKIAHSLSVLLSEKLGCECFTEITALEKNTAGYEIKKKVYDSNTECVFPCTETLVATVARGACKIKQNEVVYTTVPLGALGKRPNWFIESTCLHLKEKSSLEKAELLFVAGRGLGSENNVQRLMLLAKKYNAAFGATRAVILRGWAPIDNMIGQSGTITAAKICVTFGVSGSGPFIAGIEQAKIIVAINSDTSASIFHSATYGIVADCISILTALEKSFEDKKTV